MRTTPLDNRRTGEPRRRFNRRAAITGALMTLVLVGLIGSGRGSQTLAQEGTPEAGMAIEGATFEPLAAGSAPVLPPAPASFQLVRVRIEPGGHISVPTTDPGIVLIWVESGTMTATSTDAVSVMRAALLATPETQPFEDIAAGAEFTVGPGDSFVGHPDAGGDFRNDGADEVILLIAGLQPEATAPPAT